MVAKLNGQQITEIPATIVVVEPKTQYVPVNAENDKKPKTKKIASLQMIIQKVQHLNTKLQKDKQLHMMEQHRVKKSYCSRERFGWRYNCKSTCED